VALTKRPMVISYKLSWLTYQLVKRKLKLPFVGLPNVLAGRFVVPELLQDEATVDKLAAEVSKLYQDQDSRQEIVTTFQRMHEVLKLDSAKLAARAVLRVARC